MEILRDKFFKIKAIDSNDKLLINQFYNIGIYPGNEIYICGYRNNKIVNVIVDNIQYALRIEDLKKIVIYEIDK